MRHSTKTRIFTLSAVAALLLAVSIPTTSLAQGRGNGRGHGKGNSDRAASVWRNGDLPNRIERDRSNGGWRNRTGNLPNYSKKCAKFVNCHDASEGRIDGRGPRGTRVGNVISRNRFRNRNGNDVWRNRIRTRRNRVYENR